jgi:alkane 1-monooxygenase
MASVSYYRQGREIRHVDDKRHAWLLSLSFPLTPLLGIALYFASGRHPVALAAPLIYIFVLVPTLDAIVGEERHNPPEEIVPLLANDGYYRLLLFSGIVLHYLDFAAVAWFVGTQMIPWWGFLTLTLATGFVSSGAILIGHELGHKANAFDAAAAQIAHAVVGYGHFRIEHNHGHHVQVATPEDVSSARMGESVYRFACREIPGALRRGWRLERQRLARSGRRPWSIYNSALQSWCLTAVIAALLILELGWILIPFLLIHHVYAWYGLTQANYVQHYGLLRPKLPTGRYARCTAQHSWNANHSFSNLLSFNLQRHSDHHANALRPYQALRHVEGSPQLPSGYPGCFVLAAIPTLWFAVMHPKLLRWAADDINLVNVDPRRRDELYRRYAPGSARARPAEW